MRNIPWDNSHLSRLIPTALIARINNEIVDMAECQWYITSITDIKKKWVYLCAYLLQENKHLDIVELIIDHSSQKGIPYNIDITKEIWEGRTLLSYTIKYGNYKIFEKILGLWVTLKWLSKDTITDIVIYNSWGDLWDRVKILKELLTLWLWVNKKDIITIVNHSKAEFLRAISESSYGKKVLKPNFIKEIFKEYPNILKEKSDMMIELITAFASNTVNETIISFSTEDLEKLVSQELDQTT